MSVTTLFKDKPQATRSASPAEAAIRMAEIQARVVEIDGEMASLAKEKRRLLRENQRLLPTRLKLILAAGLAAAGLLIHPAFQIGMHGINYASHRATLVFRQSDQLTYDNKSVQVIIWLTPKQGRGMDA